MVRAVPGSGNAVVCGSKAGGHILYVLEGELVSELKDGRTTVMTAGMSYQVSDFGDAAHRSSTKTGA